MWEFSTDGSGARWRAVESPVDGTYHDAAVTANGPCAVAAGGSVVARAADGTWGVIVENGPSARGETLSAVGATDDGQRIWFAGANGALGCYEVAAGRRLDRSDPQGVTDAFGALAVAGPRGAEKLLLADGSGRVFPAAVSGSRLDWGPTSNPSGDTAVSALDATPAGVGYAVDSNANVYRTTETEGGSGSASKAPRTASTRSVPARTAFSSVAGTAASSRATAAGRRGRRTRSAT
ncbi:hypothetical protein ACFQL4_10155 [Halosimplex aquaticum]